MIASGVWIVQATQLLRTNPKFHNRTATEQIQVLLLGVAIGLHLFFVSLFVVSGIDAQALTSKIIVSLVIEVYHFS
jgi:hypothetical protein